jgi:hypothetical protein
MVSKHFWPARSLMINELHHKSNVAVMGLDAGFDMVPRLSEDSFDQQTWKSFIDFIKELYKNDKLVEVQPTIICFRIDEGASLPIEGHKCLRFSSKISGIHSLGVQNYLDKVTVATQDYSALVFKHGMMYPMSGHHFMVGKRQMNYSKPMSKYVMCCSLHACVLTFTISMMVLKP